MSNIYFAGLLILFALYLIFQHALVFLQHDDWGVSVLHYIDNVTGFEGQNFSLAQAMEFIAGMYTDWSGRIISIFLHVYLQKGGIWVVRIAQVSAIIAVAVLSYSITIKVLRIEHNVYLLGLSMCLYLAIPASTLISGVYWFSAASGYLWGVPVFLLGAYLSILRQRISLPPYFLFAAAATFHELMGVAVLAYLAATLFFNKAFQPIKAFTYSSIPALAACITIFAPGNFARKSVSEYQSPALADTIISNLTTISDRLLTPTLFGIHNFFFAIIAVSSAIMLYTILSKSLSSIQSIITVVITASIYSLVYICLAPAFAGLLFALVYTALLILTCKSRDRKMVIQIYCASIGTLILLLIAPGVAWRAHLPFLLLMFIPVLFAFGLLQDTIHIRTQKALILILSLFALSNSMTITAGYSKNYPIHVANDAILKAARKKSRKNSETNPAIVLYKIPAPRFAETMPYDRPIIETWIKQYYSLPQSTKLTWLGE